MNAITDELKEYIDQRDNAVEARIKLWIFGAILANVLGMVPVIFFLGGIYADGRTAVELLEAQQAELTQRGVWMQDRERWEMSVEMWARDQGYEPPRYSRDPRRRGN